MVPHAYGVLEGAVMDEVKDPPDHYYKKEAPWLWEREWREDEDEDSE
jgi:hypothetical protein